MFAHSEFNIYIYIYISSLVTRSRKTYFARSSSSSQTRLTRGGHMYSHFKLYAYLCILLSCIWLNKDVVHLYTILRMFYRWQKTCWTRSNNSSRTKSSRMSCIVRIFWVHCIHLHSPNKFSMLTRTHIPSQMHTSVFSSLCILGDKRRTGLAQTIRRKRSHPEWVSPRSTRTHIPSQMHTSVWSSLCFLGDKRRTGIAQTIRRKCGIVWKRPAVGTCQDFWV